MSYRLKTEESLAAGIRRIAWEQLEGALCEMKGMTAGNEAEAVHATRKHIKKTRALLRLVREQLGDERYREENGRLRETARAFSSSRDARVQLETLADVCQRAQQKTTDFPHTSKELQHEISAISDSFGARRLEAVATLQHIADRIEGWPVDKLGPNDLSCALQHAYRRGRKCFRCVSKEPLPEQFHSWRKRVKDIWYQARLLQNLDEEVVCAIAAAAKNLGQKLGALHDLAFFRAQLEASQTKGEDERAILLGLICTRERELERICVDLGARFFAEKPGRFGRRVLRYASDRRVESGPA
ncbi:MAG: CHAD domain-containing protein [Spartobacteria bacterium]